MRHPITPRESLCSRAYCRELQRILLGDILDKPDLPEEDDEQEARLFDISKISPRKFAKWWLGQCLPIKKTRTQLDQFIECPSHKWFEPSPYQNRLACHFICFGLSELAYKESIKDAKEKAEQLIKVIHNDWQISLEGNVSVTLSKPTEQKNLDSYDKNFRTSIKTPLSSKTLISHEPLNSHSIIEFLLNLTIELEPSNSKLGDALALDIGTALHAYVFLLKSANLGIPFRGKLATTASLTLRFLHDSDDNDELLSSLELSLKNLIGTAKMQALIELRKTYRKIMTKRTGLRSYEIKQYVDASLDLSQQKC